VKAVSAIVCLIASGLSTQTPPAFEVASIRQSDPNERGTCGEFLAGGKYKVAGCPLTYIIQKLYGLREFQIINAPKWICEGPTSTFAIEAKSGRPAGNDQLRLMAQNLLSDRFRLRFHRETRTLSVYALIVGRNGSKLHPARDDGSPRGSGGIDIRAPGWINGSNVSLSHFVDLLSGRVDRPVIDKTDFANPIDFSLRWAPDGSGDTSQPSIFTALEEQLGLKLEPQKLPTEVLVIDHVEQPSAN
jgi:uncharacterized protein (TIGR03435 family)